MLICVIYRDVLWDFSLMNDFSSVVIYNWQKAVNLVYIYIPAIKIKMNGLND